MSLPPFLAKSTDTPTPVALRAVVWLTAARTGLAAQGALRTLNFLQLSVALVAAVVLVGLWNLKRWAVFSYAALATLAVMTAASKYWETAPRGVIAGAVFHLIMLGPAVYSWRKMTWT